MPVNASGAATPTTVAQIKTVRDAHLHKRHCHRACVLECGGTRSTTPLFGGGSTHDVTGTANLP
jgi:hypothetical protein